MVFFGRSIKILRVRVEEGDLRFLYFSKGGMGLKEIEKYLFGLSFYCVEKKTEV